MADALPDPVQTAELLARSRSGDRLAEYQLWSSLRRFLERRAGTHPRMGMLRDKLSADDVVQEVWVRLQSPGALDAFEDRGKGSLRRFLVAFLETTIVDLIRRHHAERRGGATDLRSMDAKGNRTLSMQVESDEPTPTSEARVGDYQGRIESILQPRELDVWRLRTEEGLDFLEIGRRLEITEDAARSLHRRARERLGDRLDP